MNEFFSSKLLDSSAETSSLPYHLLLESSVQNAELCYFCPHYRSCKSLHDAFMGDPDVDAEVYWTRADALKARGAGCESGGGIGMPLVSFSRDPRLAAAPAPDWLSSKRNRRLAATRRQGQPEDCNAADVFNAVDTTRLKQNWPRQSFLARH